MHLVASIGYPVLSRAVDPIMHRHKVGYPTDPGGPRSRPGYAVPARHHLIDPIRPTRGHIATSPHGGLYAMSSLCGSAEATREWIRAFTAHSFLACRPLRPRGIRHRQFQTAMSARRRRAAAFNRQIEEYQVDPSHLEIPGRLEDCARELSQRFPDGITLDGQNPAVRWWILQRHKIELVVTSAT